VSLVERRDDTPISRMKGLDTTFAEGVARRDLEHVQNVAGVGTPDHESTDTATATTTLSQMTHKTEIGTTAKTSRTTWEPSPCLTRIPRKLVMPTHEVLLRVPDGHAGSAPTAMQPLTMCPNMNDIWKTMSSSARNTGLVWAGRMSGIMPGRKDMTDVS